MNDYQIIISRYNENIEWIKTFDDYIVFNKGSADGLSEEILNRTYNLPNFGISEEVILRYIITHYNYLPDKVAFCQGNYFDHYQLSVNEFKNQLLTLRNGYSILNYHYDRYAEASSNRSSFNIKEWPLGNQLENYKPEYNLANWWKELSGEEYVQKPIVFWGSIFCVHKSLVYRRPLSFYNKMHKYYIKNKFPVETHFAERSWANTFKI